MQSNSLRESSFETNVIPSLSHHRVELRNEGRYFATVIPQPRQLIQIVATTVQLSSSIIRRTAEAASDF